VYVVSQCGQQRAEQAVELEAVPAALPLHNFLVEVGHQEVDALSLPLAVGIARDGERLERNDGDVCLLQPREKLPVRRPCRLWDNAETRQICPDLLFSKSITGIRPRVDCGHGNRKA
jgi:hypothetical protein